MECSRNYILKKTQTYLQSKFAIYFFLFKNPHFVKSLDNFDVLPNQRNILLTFVAGEDALFSETIEEECLLDIIHELLTRSFPKLNIPRPKQIVR
jgi:hypothetical protein